MKPTRDQIKKVRFSKVSPEGYILLREEVLEQLKDFDVWKSWKNEEISLLDLDNKDISE
jgi:hypothetical protein